MLFLLMLTEGRQLSQVALNEVIIIYRTISKQTVSQIKEEVLSALNDAGVNSAIIPGLDDSFLPVPDPFEKLDTPYLREKFYWEHFNYQVCFISHTFIIIQENNDISIYIYRCGWASFCHLCTTTAVR